ncbi:unnamed protein product [Rodentolepis nana]|uniref:Uncharacterized protein n=1 Tax=Rodentolepis nana TaxID=102285 RepID=A0A0R3T702_RODNA|nr:unnamed protein product [Rodentolepis nana]
MLGRSRLEWCFKYLVIQTCLQDQDKLHVNRHSTAEEEEAMPLLFSSRFGVLRPTLAAMESTYKGGKLTGH